MKIIIETYGTKLSLNQGVMIIENENKTKEISLLHITSIHIQKAARISSELITACVRSEIPIYFENDFEISALLWSPHYGSISNIRKKQALFSFSIYKYKLIKRLIISKNLERILFLRQNTQHRKVEEILLFLEQINEDITQVPNDVQKLRSLEAFSSKKYYVAYNFILPKEFRFKKRSYRNSRDITNILLNYGYGILYNDITKALIIAGLDPDLGFFHVAQYNRPSLSFDMIEPYRVWCEKNVLKTLKMPELKKIDTYLDDNGKLSKPLKHLFVEVFTHFMSKKKIKWHKRIKTPATHIQLDAYQTAKYLLNFSYDDLLTHLITKINK